MQYLPDGTRLEDLADFRQISNGVMHLCRRHGLLTLGALRDWLRHRPFIDLHGCGTKKDMELKDLLAWADGQDGAGLERVSPVVRDEIMSRNAVSGLHTMVRDRFDRLSVRARNSVSTFLSSLEPLGGGTTPT